MNYIERTINGITIDGIFDIDTSLKKYINTLCLKDGSSYEGRYQYSKQYIGSHKTPIYINDDLLLFPTTSIRQYHCVFLNVLTIENYLKQGENTIITFRNGNTKNINISSKKLEKQIKRCDALIRHIQKRKCLHEGVINRFYI